MIQRILRHLRLPDVVPEIGPRARRPGRVVRTTMEYRETTPEHPAAPIGSPEVCRAVARGGLNGLVGVDAMLRTAPNVARVVALRWG